MNLEQLQKVLKMFEDSSLTLLDVQEGEERIRLERGNQGQAIASAMPTAAAHPAPAAPPPAQVTSAGPDFNRIIEVKSPVVGIFYEAPEPGGKPFVQVGDLVQKGDVLCLVEVMKQVTEVTAPQDGQVADVCVPNGSVVEYGQTLIKLC